MAKRKNLTTIITVIMVIVLIAGVGLMLYPTIANLLNSHETERMISSYDRTVDILTEEEKEAMLADAEEYNESIRQVSSQLSLMHPEVLEGYNEILDPSGTGIMGYISIPKIDVKLPIYHGTSDEVLAVGAGHTEGSGFPIGGESTHAIISAHSGFPSARLFTDLEKMEIGDVFMITVLGDVLTYEVDNILVTDPSEVESLLIVDGEDLVTLVTCTPYGINTERLLVRGHRIPTTDEEIELLENMNNNSLLIIILIAIAVLIVIGIIVLVVWRLRKRHERSDEVET